MMRIAAAFAFSVVVAGCQGVSTVTQLEDDSKTPGSAQSGSLALQLDAPAQARVGTPLRLKLTLTNTTKQPVQVMLGGRPPYDFVLTSADGAKSWRWSADQAIQMILETRTLKPGEQLAYDAEWRVKDRSGDLPSPGRYKVRAVLNMDPPDKLETTARELVLTE
jgi:hypothetical protein